MNILQVVPKAHERSCRAFISTQPGVRYTVAVAAIHTHDGTRKMSNELSITLPLDCSEIVLPPPELRSTNIDIYREYLEVRDGNTEPSSAGRLLGASSLAVQTTPAIFYMLSCRKGLSKNEK